MVPDSGETSNERAAAMGNNTAKLASSLFIVRVLTFVVIGLTYIFIVRLLGPSSYGVYTIAIATAGTFGAFGDLGISTMFVKFIPQYLRKKQSEKIKSLLISGFSIIILESGLFTLLAILLSGFVAQSVLHSAADAFPLQIAAFTIILGVIWSSCYTVLIAFGKSRKLANAFILQTLLQSFGSLALVLLGLGAVGAILGLIISYVVGIPYAIKVATDDLKIKSEDVKFTLKGSKSILSFSLPIGFTSAINAVVSNFSLIVLGIFATTVIIGNFGAAYRAVSLFDVLIGSIGIALLPFFAVTFSDKKITKKVNKFYNYSLYFAFLFAVPIIFYIVVLSQQFSYTVFSAVYTLTPLYLAIMAIGTLLLTVTTYTTNLLFGAGRVRKVMKYNIIAAIIQLILLPIFVSTLNGLGLTLIIFIIMPTILNIMLLNRAQKSFNVKIDFVSLGRVILSGIISALFIIPLILLLNSNYIPLLAAAAIEQIIIYPIIISHLGGINKEKLELMKRITIGIPFVGPIMRLLVEYTSIFVH